MVKSFPIKVGEFMSPVVLFRKSFQQSVISIKCFASRQSFLTIQIISFIITTLPHKFLKNRSCSKNAAIYISIWIEYLKDTFEAVHLKEGYMIAN